MDIARHRLQLARAADAGDLDVAADRVYSRRPVHLADGGVAGGALHLGVTDAAADDQVGGARLDVQLRVMWAADEDRDLRRAVEEEAEPSGRAAFGHLDPYLVATRGPAARVDPRLLDGCERGLVVPERPDLDGGLLLLVGLDLDLARRDA